MCVREIQEGEFLVTAICKVASQKKKNNNNNKTALEKKKFSETQKETLFFFFSDTPVYTANTTSREHYAPQTLS